MSQVRGQINGHDTGGEAEGPVVIYSSLADDPAMGELLERFIADVPARLRAMQAACRRGDMPGLSHLAMLMRGAAGGFGFAELSQAAGELAEMGYGDLPMSKVKQGLRRLTSLYEAAMRGLEWGDAHRRAAGVGG